MFVLYKTLVNGFFGNQIINLNFELRVFAHEFHFRQDYHFELSVVKLEIYNFFVFHVFLKNGLNVIPLKVRFNQPNFLTFLGLFHNTKALVIN